MFFFLSISKSSIAFQVSTLYKIIENKDSYITLTGNSEREFIYTSLSQIKVDNNGELKESTLSPEYISKWPVIVEPGEIILNGNEEVRVKITKNIERLFEDQVIGLSFIPDILDKKNSNADIKIAMGYKTWLFIPGESDLKGDVYTTRDKNTIFINNKTNKILMLNIDDKNSKTNTPTFGDVIFSLPGTKKSINVENKVKIFFHTLNNNQEKIKEVTL